MGERNAWQKKYVQSSADAPVFQKGTPIFAQMKDRLDVGAYGIVEVEGVRVIAQVVSGGLRLYQATDSTWIDTPGIQYQAIAEIIGVQCETLMVVHERQAGTDQQTGDVNSVGLLRECLGAIAD